jgi:hypothetical protein
MGVKMETTSLYIPLTDFTINDQDGFKILYDNLVQSGPAYRLVVHDSPSWREIRDKIQNPEDIIILDEKKAEYYKQASIDFFAPITETYRIYIKEDGKKDWTSNLLIDMRCALSYILIAYDYKARIFEDDILDYFNPLEGMTKSELPENCINRVKIVDNLLKGYYRTQVPTVFMNRDKAEIENLKKLLLQTEMKTLSTLNYKFGEITVNKQVLVRDIKESIKVALKSDWLPHVIGAGVLGLSYCIGLGPIQDGVLALLADAGATALSKINFKEYVPPIQEPRLYALGGPTSGKISTFSSQRFNQEYNFYIEK